MSVSIRIAAPADGPAIYRAWGAIREHYAATDGRVVNAPVGEPEFIAALRDSIARATSCTMVAERGEALAGFISGGIEQNQPGRLPERHATIGYLYVAPEHRREGIGRQLVGALSAWAAKQDGVNHLEMTVLARDSAAAAFWRSLGFAPFIERLWAPLAGSES
ncbi:MAG: GNAT family N-acetyltransferase [Dehalococcoidia bacterium]